MGRFIIKLREFYLEYSTIVDAPVTDGMKLREFTDYYKSQYGEEGLEGLPARLARVEEKGTSAFADVDVDDTLSCNRAGPNETTLTREDIFQAYCLGEPLKDGPKGVMNLARPLGLFRSGN